MVHLVPCSESIDAEETASLLLRHVFKLHGLPDKIISDRGPQFASKFWMCLFQTLGIQHSMSSAFHPQSNGQTERTNQSIEQYLRCFVNYEQSNWIDLLPFAEFAFNNSISSATNHTPFETNNGFHPRMDFFLKTPSIDNPSATTFVKRIVDIQERVHTALIRSKELMLKANSSNKKNQLAFHEGDLVWLKTDHLSSNRPCAKLTHKKCGPFKVLQKIGSLTYKLDLPNELAIHPSIHVSRLERFIPRPGIDPVLPSHDSYYNNEYEVKEILDCKVSDNVFSYLVRWRNFSSNDDTWESLENLSNCLGLIRRFHRSNPNHPKPPRNLLVKRRMMLRT